MAASPVNKGIFRLDDSMCRWVRSGIFGYVRPECFPTLGEMGKHFEKWGNISEVKDCNTQPRTAGNGGLLYGYCDGKKTIKPKKR